MASGGTWNPDQYERFRDERLAPARDLVALVEPGGVRRALDLGCGTGEPTALLAAHLPEARIEGIDSSAEMLAKAAPRATDRVTFRRGDIEAVGDLAGIDLLFSNAALHWVDGHEALFARWLSSLPAGGQVAVQVPANERHASHRAAAAVASTAPFVDWLGGFSVRPGTLPLERYAQLLWEHGFSRTHLAERVYCHTLSDSAGVVEWVKGSLLVPYLGRLAAAQQEAFLAAYRARLLGEIGEAAPYLLTYRRLFLWARKG